VLGQTFPHGRGNITVITGMDEKRCNLFGLGVVPHHEEGNVKFAYPYGGESEVFGLNLGDEGCTCPPINMKNSSMVGLGSLVAWKGLGLGGKVDLFVRMAAGAVAVLGLLDIAKGFEKRAPSPPSVIPPAPQADSVPSDVYGLGIYEWYPQQPQYQYNRRFMHELTNRYYVANGMRVPSYMR
jgi:hypothetical protein